MSNLFQVVHTFGRDGKKNVHLHLSVTCGGLAANNTQWKALKFIHFIFMKAWRKAVTNLIWQAYKAGRLSLPDDKPTLTAIRAWLKGHYLHDYLFSLFLKLLNIVIYIRHRKASIGRAIQRIMY
jgi:hypothetical protein